MENIKPLCCDVFFFYIVESIAALNSRICFLALVLRIQQFRRYLSDTRRVWICRQPVDGHWFALGYVSHNNALCCRQIEISLCME